MGMEDIFQMTTNDVIALVLVYALIIVVLAVALITQKKKLRIHLVDVRERLGYGSIFRDTVRHNSVPGDAEG